MAAAGSQSAACQCFACVQQAVGGSKPLTMASLPSTGSGGDASSCQSSSLATPSRSPASAFHLYPHIHGNTLLNAQQHGQKLSPQKQTPILGPAALNRPFAQQPLTFYPDAKFVLSAGDATTVLQQQQVSGTSQPFAASYPTYYNLVPYDAGGDASCVTPQGTFGVSDYLAVPMQQYVVSANHTLLVQSNVASAATMSSPSFDQYNLSLAHFQQQQQQTGPVYEVPATYYSPMLPQSFGQFDVNVGNSESSSLPGLGLNSTSGAGSGNGSTTSTSAAASSSTPSSAPAQLATVFAANSAFAFNNASALTSSLFPLGCNGLTNGSSIVSLDNSCLRTPKQQFIVASPFVPVNPVGVSTSSALQQAASCPNTAGGIGLQACRFTPIVSPPSATASSSNVGGNASYPLDATGNGSLGQQLNFNFSLSPPRSTVGSSTAASSLPINWPFATPPQQQQQLLAQQQQQLYAYSNAMAATSAEPLPASVLPCSVASCQAAAPASIPAMLPPPSLPFQQQLQQQQQNGGMNALGSSTLPAVPAPPPSHTHAGHTHSHFCQNNNDNDSSDETNSTRSSSTSNSNTKDKFCDCCYCELLGNPAVIG